VHTSGPPTLAHARRSGGYGLSLIAESTTGVVLSAEMVAQEGVLPEDLGKHVAALLLEEIGKVMRASTSHLDHHPCLHSARGANTAPLYAGWQRGYVPPVCSVALHGAVSGGCIAPTPGQAVTVHVSRHSRDSAQPHAWLLMHT
jgi:hypothetical protein